MRRLLPLVVWQIACGHPGSSENVARREDGGVQRRDATASLTPLQLGQPDVAAFGYRKRAGQTAFNLAREAEAAGDWTSVAVRCREALTTDPQHLDAAYLLAVALAKTGGGAEQILAPLTKAVAADYAKWGQASLDQPALQPFLATSIGQAWRKRVEDDRQAFIAALARSLIVTSEHDLFAYDEHGTRWYRLTRTGGAIVATLHVRSQHKIAYVTREKITEAGKQRTKVGVGIVELATGRSRRSIEVPGVPPSATLRISYAEKKAPGFIVRVGKDAWRLVDTGKLTFERVPPNVKADAPAYLADMIRMDVSGRSARIDRTAVANVAADWDDSSLASAIKIGRSKKVVTVPSPGLIDGDTATWSSDGTQLAFVAQLSDTCAPNVATAAAFVADGATGKVSELERAIGGIAIEWYGERRLAIAGDHGVSIVALGGDAVALVGADGLVTPRRKPKCSPEPAGEEPIAEEEEASAVEPTDAGVR
jgi:hypothetical protein